MIKGGKFAVAAGVVYTIVGLLGFIVTGFRDFASTTGEALIILEVNPLHNVVHLALGLVWLATASKASAVRKVNLVLGGALLLVGIAGFFLQGTDANVLALDTGDNLFHIITGAAALFLGVTEKPAAAQA